ncbi:hypothetical protein BJP36_37855 [Moorena producens JHB]|uniref:Uncharacterized protein n=1 Tax=Moorena producens (strain JHB) TaxID=1454205 RepID=A0A9Q9SUG5_MOOP1|nr:hypothetical protein [Moorena producens]WAN69862.1 hypothetical protein BJP36_37855 [Moorena producens JHB]
MARNVTALPAQGKCGKYGKYGKCGKYGKYGKCGKCGNFCLIAKVRFTLRTSVFQLPESSKLSEELALFV